MSTTEIFFRVQKNPIAGKKYILLTVIDLLIGLAWNIQDYYADRRIDWCLIVKKLEDLEQYYKNKLYKGIFKSILRHEYWTFANMWITFGFVVGLVLKILEDGVFTGEFTNGNILKNAYALMFVAILTLYIKTVFSLYYGRKIKAIGNENKEENIVYPSFLKMLMAFKEPLCIKKRRVR